VVRFVVVVDVEGWEEEEAEEVVIRVKRGVKGWGGWGWSCDDGCSDGGGGGGENPRGGGRLVGGDAGRGLWASGDGGRAAWWRAGDAGPESVERGGAPGRRVPDVVGGISGSEGGRNNGEEGEGRTESCSLRGLGFEPEDILWAGVYVR
jgi:hypothetical protein